MMIKQMDRQIKRIDKELKRFKADLETATPGITASLEKRNHDC